MRKEGGFLKHSQVEISSSVSSDECTLRVCCLDKVMNERWEEKSRADRA